MIPADFPDLMLTPLMPDVMLAVATIWQEARGEPYAGKVAVAEVIRTRMRERYSSDGTVAGTVLRAYQFSGWNTSDPQRIKAAMVTWGDPRVQECLLAWHESRVTHWTLGAQLYHADYVKPGWAERVNLLTRIGRHLFYRDPYSRVRV